MGGVDSHVDATRIITGIDCLFLFEFAALLLSVRFTFLFSDLFINFVE